MKDDLLANGGRKRSVNVSCTMAWNGIPFDEKKRNCVGRAREVLVAGFRVGSSFSSVWIMGWMMCNV
jgi:hypothetical protein